MHQQYRTLVFWLSIFTLLSVCSCVTTGSTKPLTSKQQATIWMNVYSAQYDDTMAMAKSPKITPAQKEIVAKKKAALLKIYPLLRAYVTIVDSGGMPTAEATIVLFNLINDLIAISGGR